MDLTPDCSSGKASTEAPLLPTAPYNRVKPAVHIWKSSPCLRDQMRMGQVGSFGSGEGELDGDPHRLSPCSPEYGSKACVSLSLSLVSLIRGQVVTTDGTPLIGVNVSFVKYPKYGYTITRQDGT